MESTQFIEVEKSANRLGDMVADTILSMVNEPSAGLYQVEQHVRRAVPRLCVQNDEKLVDLSNSITAGLYDVEYCADQLEFFGRNTRKSFFNTSKHISRSIEIIEKNLIAGVPLKTRPSLNLINAKENKDKNDESKVEREDISLNDDSNERDKVLKIEIDSDTDPKSITRENKNIKTSTDSDKDKNTDPKSITRENKNIKTSTDSDKDKNTESKLSFKDNNNTKVEKIQPKKKKKKKEKRNSSKEF